jgi:hypothetical protein
MKDAVKKKVRRIMQEKKISFRQAHEELKRLGGLEDKQPIVEYRIRRGYTPVQAES